MNRSTNFYVGLAGWAIASVGAVIGLSRGSDLSLAEFAQTTVQTLFDPAVNVEIKDESSRLRVGDPVFLQTSFDHWTQVGSVQKLGSEPGSISLAWYDDQAASGFDFSSHFQSGRLDEVIQTMLPAQQRDRISAKVSLLMKQHGEEMAESILPLLKTSLRQSMPVIELAIQESAARHRGEIDDLANRWNEEVVRETLIPLAREEILPIVRKHAQPVVEDMGRELWDRASLWRFGWRAVYDKSPLPKQDLVQDEWDRFVQEEALPVLESHTDELVDTVQKTVQGIARNSRVRSELGNVASELSSDPAAKQLLATILRETLIDNDSLRDVWQSVWTSDEAKQILDRVGDRVEPMVREIGDELFGTPETGINANFARVLRQQILGKDRRFVIARPRQTRQPADSPIVIRRSKASMPYPVVYLANPDSAEPL
ncbi:hypothetical protein LF1_42610 [Rubripirellula obstinata]|uniref:Uncharacterized protein n=1 Tax=Rubripirellula obstinata TaxID=406547 RepID=A0A5B1CMD6_9BACT|nr:hypothetical protein [Rubripirellula obstinata]KAA1261706.1 hypothetical protein LF1_42610 [Rubripirellula obstinata]